MDGVGARDHGGDRVRRAVAGVEHGAAGVGGRAGHDGGVRRRDGAAVHDLRRLLPVAGPGARAAPQPHLRPRRRAQPRYVRDDPFHTSRLLAFTVLFFFGFVSLFDCR